MEENNSFCVKCGAKLEADVKFCPKCGVHVDANEMQDNIQYRKDGYSSGLQKQRSNWWYLLAILFSPIGGIIAYFAIRHDDPSKAKNCLIIGFILFGIGLVVGMATGL